MLLYHTVGSTTTVTIITSRLADISMDTPISLSLIDTDDGVVIATTPLIRCSEFLTGSVMIPNTTFQYQLRGTDIHGFAFEHTLNRLVNPTPPDKRVVTQLDCPTPSTPTIPPITTRSPGSSSSMTASIISSVIVATAVGLAVIM